MSGPGWDGYVPGHAEDPRRPVSRFRAPDPYGAARGVGGPVWIPPAPPPQPPRPRRRPGYVLVALVAVAMVAAMLLQAGRGLAPLGTPPAVAEGQGTYEFQQTHDDGRPVTYDPCRPVRYVVNDTLAPPGADAVVDSAIAEIAAATGLVLEDAGTTDEAPSVDRDTRDLLRYGTGHSPVLIAWATEEQVPELADAAGIGGSTSIGTGDDMRYVTGIAFLDATSLTEVMTWPNGPAQVRAVVMHELGHVVGLGHVDDPHELMQAENTGQTWLGPGDREGLALLGSGECA